jgi:hypothetical protein
MAKSSVAKIEDIEEEENDLLPPNPLKGLDPEQCEKVHIDVRVYSSHLRIR